MDILPASWATPAGSCAPATLWSNHGRGVWLNYQLPAQVDESDIRFEVEDPDINQPVSIAVFTACGGVPVACASRRRATSA